MTPADRAQFIVLLKATSALLYEAAEAALTHRPNGSVLAPLDTAKRNINRMLDMCEQEKPS